jgi:hypothetical protein
VIIFRACLVVAALVTSVTGIQKLYLRLQCPEQIELQAAQLEQNEEWGSTEPVWTLITDGSTPRQPAILTSTPGNQRGALLPLASPADPERILAVVAFDSASAALRHHKLTGTIRTAGVGRVPTPDTEETMNLYAKRTGLTISPVWRIITLREEPMTLAALARQAVFGSFLLLLLLLSIRYDNVLRIAWAPVREKISTLFPHREPSVPGEPLPAAFRIRVRSMMDEIWDEARKKPSKRT